jgi:carbon storage regulator
MLVLSRKSGQSVRINDMISVTVLGVRGGKVKLGLSGPPEVPFFREEVYRQIHPNGAQISREEPVLAGVCD